MADTYAKIRWLNRLGLFNVLRDWRNRQAIKDPQMKAFFAEFIRPGDLVFDIGANIGQMTDMYRSCGARVVAVEPQPACVGYLSRKYKNTPQVTVVPKAVSDKPGKQSMYLSAANAVSTMSETWKKAVQTSGRMEKFQWERTIEVETLTLDNLIRQYGRPHFCKIDVEGLEWPVVRGLSSRIGMMSLELCPENRAEIVEAVTYLARLGADTFQHAYTHRGIWTFPSWISHEALIQELRTENSTRQYGDVYVRFPG